MSYYFCVLSRKFLSDECDKWMPSWSGWKELNALSNFVGRIAWNCVVEVRFSLTLIISRIISILSIV